MGSSTPGRWVLTVMIGTRNYRDEGDWPLAMITRVLPSGDHGGQVANWTDQSFQSWRR